MCFFFFPFLFLIFQPAPFFLHKSYRRVLQHLSCLPKWFSVGCCQEYWVSTSVTRMCQIQCVCMKGHNFLPLSRSPASSQSSGLMQPGSLDGEFAMLTDSSLQDQTEEKGEPYLQLLFSPPTFTSTLWERPSQRAPVLSFSHPKRPSLSPYELPPLSVCLSFNPLLILDSL